MQIYLYLLVFVQQELEFLMNCQQKLLIDQIAPHAAAAVLNNYSLYRIIATDFKATEELVLEVACWDLLMMSICLKIM